MLQNNNNITRILFSDKILFFYLSSRYNKENFQIKNYYERKKNCVKTHNMGKSHTTKKQSIYHRRWRRYFNWDTELHIKSYIFSQIGYKYILSNLIYPTVKYKLLNHINLFHKWFEHINMNQQNSNNMKLADSNFWLYIKRYTTYLPKQRISNKYLLVHKYQKYSKLLLQADSLISKLRKKQSYNRRYITRLFHEFNKKIIAKSKYAKKWWAKQHRFKNNYKIKRLNFKLIPILNYYSLKYNNVSYKNLYRNKFINLTSYSKYKIYTNITLNKLFNSGSAFLKKKPMSKKLCNNAAYWPIFFNVKLKSLLNFNAVWQKSTLTNILKLKRIYKEQYILSKKRQVRYIRYYKYRDYGNHPFHWRFSGKWQQRKKFPWLQSLIVNRILYPLQYFNMFRCLKSPWPTKRNKIYRTFISITHHRHERIKLKLGIHGGNRSIHYKLNLLKVILPFYGKLNEKQFKSIWRRYIYIKSKYKGRSSRFATTLNTSLYVLIQHLNWAPNTWWAQTIIKNGWIFISKQIANNKRQQNSVQQMFPLATNFHQISNYNNTVNAKQSEKSLYFTLKQNEIIQINPQAKLTINQFFSRTRRWNKKKFPNYIEVDSKATNAILIDEPLYSLTNVKQRNKKTFLRFLLH